MFDTVTKYNIFDTSGNCYKVDDRNNLVVAQDIIDATPFSFFEANQRVGKGRRAHFYRIMEADPALTPSVTVTSDSPVFWNDPEYESFRVPTKFDGLHNNWELLLSDLCYLSEHIGEYQNNLNQMLSDVDKEICDILHYLEFTDLSDSNLLKAGRMLQDCRRRRRDIKNEIDRTDSMCASFLNGNFGDKVRQSLISMKRMNERQYSPRKLNELFGKGRGRGLGAGARGQCEREGKVKSER